MRMTQLRARRDAGFTLAELLVAMVISTVVIAVGISLLSSTFRVAASTQTRAELWGSMTNSSVQLIRDVNDGSKITTSEPKHLAVQVVRDGKCQTRDWEVTGDKLISTTIFYDATSCTGGSTERKVESIKGGLSDFTFTYFSAASIDTPLPAPVAPGVVNRVGWTMAATPTDATAVLRLESGAAFTGRGSSTDGTGANQNALAGFLSVITNTSGIEGVSAPVLSWTDATPELTQGWAVYRTSYPDGADAASSTGWEQIAYLRTATPAPGTMTYTDRTLPRGYTALYIVRATVPDGYGPSSNQVATGLRPAASAITSDGTPTSIALSWTAPVGTTGYDIYRTEGGTTATTPVLYKRWDDIKSSATKTGTGSALRWSWTDNLPAGRAHTYSIVPVNRWERVATTSSQTASLPVGEALAKTYAGGTGTTQKVARDASNTSNNFTVAAAPTTTLALSSATSATDYGSNVTWAPAAWVGGGSETVTAATQSGDQGVHRDRGWDTERRGSAWAAVWTTETPRASVMRKDTGTAPDITYGYRTRTMNSSGASVWATEARILQRPAVPAAPSAVLSGLTTRQATITAATSPSATSWQVQKVTGPSSAAMAGVKAANASRQIVYNELGHSAAHTWQTRSSNVAPAGVFGGGTSAWGATSGVTTDRLRVWLSDGSKTTRSVSARLNNENGNSANITVEGHSTQPSNGGGQMHTFDPLVHNTNYTLTGRLSDGYNNVSDQAVIRTDELRVWLSDGSASTRSISARVNNLNGNNASVTVEGFQTQPTSGGGQLHTFDPLVHNTTYTLTARLTDGYNNVAYQDNIATRRLASPVISNGWSNTRRIDLTVSSAEGTPRIEIAGHGTRNGAGRHTWDPLAHATTYQAYAANTDGYNTTTTGPVAVGTARLGVSTPSCNAYRDGRYAPTTVRFTSSGSLNRSSVYAGSAGYYSALATNSNSDGYNYVSASNDCGISVEARPIINGGASGTPSATCTQYIRAADGLFGSTGSGAPSGTAYGAKESEYGVYRSGAIGTSNLSCTMIRVYSLSYVEDGAYAGSWGVAVIWNQGGSGAS